MENCIFTELKEQVTKKGLPVLTKKITVTVPANTDRQSIPELYNAFVGKVLFLKISSDSQSHSCDIRFGFGETVYKCDSRFPIPMNFDFTSIGYVLITSLSGGTFTFEYTEAQDWGKSFDIANVGNNCYVDGTAHRMIWSDASYANGFLLTPLISSKTKISFKQSTSGTISLVFYGSDGFTYVQDVSSIDTTQIYDASVLGNGFITIESNTTKHPNGIIADIEYL